MIHRVLCITSLWSCISRRTFLPGFGVLLCVLATAGLARGMSESDRSTTELPPASDRESLVVEETGDENLVDLGDDDDSVTSVSIDSSSETELELAEDGLPLAHRDDQVWLISSRSISCPTCDDSGLRFYRRIGCGWESVDRAAFDESLMTPLDNVVFVHGNRTDFSYATRRGMQAYRAFVSQQSSDRPAVRFMAWAWPSEREAVGVRDFRAKADRADLEGCLFGAFLRKLPADQRLNLIGYSFGSRIVMGGVALLSGESLSGRCLELPEDYQPPALRVTLIAAATSPFSLLPGQPYHAGYPLAERWVLINNREDRVLRMYRFVDRSSSSAAMGSIGMPTRRLPDQGARVAQWDVARSIGPQHKIDLYFASGSVGRLVREQLAWISHEHDDDEPQTARVGSAP